ncbi:MAG: Smr/MutS family protein, partial [Flavobacteriaceae bacterium]
DDVVIGSVVSIKGEWIHVLTADGFEMQFHKEELILHRDDSSIEISADEAAIAQKEGEYGSKKRTATPKKARSSELPAMEVDLHIDKLVERPDRMSTYDVLDHQLETARRQLEFAQKKGISRVIFIHGVGEGILKTELQFLFKNYSNIQYRDASFRKYGLGATEVLIIHKK